MVSELKNQKRRQYKKPQLRVIDLAAKEVLVVGCKNSDGTSPLSSFPPCWNDSCQTDGS